ncbi:T9SS type B sorting domain-containing protein [Flavobacterium sp. ABG]|uniref:T9SS type B sorting domain-containing protein n=1 Tax=Flavobacterium sp. ABG TaxID=1423322 RepID=UPI000B23C140|nr:T9SS type B sorting domain-containing protein [Flavobacterium sp. ABG]
MSAIKSAGILSLFLFSSLTHSQCTIQTTNSDFEYPVIASGSIAFINQTQHPAALLGWRTTATDNIMEFWSNGYDGRNAYSGNQFIELNAYQSSGLFQDYDTSTTPHFNYSFSHMGRFGVDTMILKVGPPGGPYTTIKTAATAKEWKVYSGTYTVPAGQTRTRFIFESSATATGNPTAGNFLDAISFTASINSPVVADKTICYNSSTTLTATGVPNASFYWYDATGTNLLHQGATFTTPVLTSDTTYKVKQINSSNCESNFLDVKVSAANIDPPLAADKTICSNSSTTLTATGITGASFYWYDATGTNLLYQGATFTTPILSSDTRYKVKQINSSNCESSFLDVKVSTANISLPMVAHKIICSNSSATLTATGVPNASFYWYDATGTNLLYQGATFTTPVLTSDTTYKVKQINSSNCESNFLDVIISAAHLGLPVVTDKTICYNSPATLTATGVPGASFYWYDTRGTNLLYQGATFTTPILSSDTTYKVKQINSSNCESNFLDVEIKINNLASPLTLTLTDDGQNEIVATASGGKPGYQYSINDGPGSQTNKFAVYESGTYTVNTTDENGCTASVSKYFEYTKIDLCIPNYFTPNGDGQNDEWGPECELNYKNLTFTIFDRYGRPLANCSYNKRWDGKYKGKELPTGDYWYTLNLNEPKHDSDFIGHFTLYR